MNIVNSLSTPFYEFQCPDNIIDTAIEEVKQLEFVSSNFNNSVDVSPTCYYNKELVNWFEECLEKIRQIYFIDSMRLVVTNCWATRTGFLKQHQSHTHSQSVVSGILYLEDADTGETVFTANNPWLRYHQDNIIAVSTQSIIENQSLYTKISPKKGKLIMYPSHIYHGTTINKNKKYRYSIAFDTFFQGKITYNAWWPYTEIKATNIHDSHNNVK